MTDDPHRHEDEDVSAFAVGGTLGMIAALSMQWGLLKTAGLITIGGLVAIPYDRWAAKKNREPSLESGE